MSNVRHVVLVFGEILIDRFPDGDALGGAPFNVAWHLQAFGCAPVLVSRIGQDAAGADLLKAMKSAGMSTQGVQLDSVYPTGTVEVRLTAEGHRFRIVPDQAYDHIHPRLSRMAALAANPELVYYGTMAQRAASHRALRHMLRATSAPRFFDVNLREPWVVAERLHWSLQHSDIVKANDEELERIAKLVELEEEAAEDQARALVRKYQLRGILITCGAKGAWWLDDDSEKAEVASGTIADVVDTVGAGDAFSAVFLLGLLHGWTISATLQRAHQFAGAICRIRGAVPHGDRFYKPFIEEWFAKR
jgi:fructokinase